MYYIYLFITNINITFYQMIVLFLNLHKSDEQGKVNFSRYYTSVTKILRQTIYYGTHYEEQIRDRQNIQDFLYDQFQRNSKQKSKQKFKSVTYVFIDGPINLPPWTSGLANVALFIRNCIKQDKKVHFNAFGHTALYYYLSTNFDKDYCIRKKGQNVTGKEDYFHDEQTGDLYSHNKLVCNSGIQVSHNINKFFQTKSVQALEKGAVLPTKFHYIAFNSKNDNSLIKNLIFPFTFFEKHKVFCTPVHQTRANITTLIQTQNKHPIVFAYKSCLSTHLLCPETIKVVLNWLTNGQEVKPFRQITIQNQSIQDVAFNNLFTLKLAKNTPVTHSAVSGFQTHSKLTKTIRPQTASSSKSKFNFEKPSVRCSGPYETIDHIRTIQQLNSKAKLLGRSRMIFKSDMQKAQIKNYVQRTPSRPPSAHNFRQINKSKWIDKKTFFVT